jgi:DNA polymerase-1
MARPTLVLIDGSSYLFRAFHALPPLANADGEPTGALFGVVNMLRDTIRQKPDRVAFVLDAEGPNFRHALYPGYKANRPPTPPDLKAQVEPMIAVVEALGIPVLRVPGVEADDVIGTLAAAGRDAGLDVLISTGDKDFAQLVGPQITLVNTMTRTSTDRDGVIAKFGVPPERIVDFLALTGDAIDNIPGVEKCGPKTAAKWLAEYGSLEGVIAAAGAVGGKIGEHLRAALPKLPLSKDLVTIRTDVPLEIGPAELAPREPDVEGLRGLYRRYGFAAALRELECAHGDDETAPGAAAALVPTGAGGDAGPGDLPAASPERRYECILDRVALERWIARLRAAPLLAFDTETTSLDPLRAELVGLSFAVEPGEACYIPVAHRYAGVPVQLDRVEVLDLLRPVLEDAAIAKVGQHGKYDLHVLRRHGVEVRGYAFDTMLESYVLHSTASRHDMDTLAKRWLGIDTIRYEDVAGRGAKQIGFDEVALDRATEYAAEDADVTLRLHQALWPRLEAEPRLAAVFRDIEMPLVPVLERMEAKGVRIDADELRRQSADLRRQMATLVERAHALAGHAFSLDSPKQLAQVLFEELGLESRLKTPTGQPSTNEEALEELRGEHELPGVVLEYRSLAKLVGTYTEKLPAMINPDTGRVHTSFHQAVAATGRLSSSDPNLQNIPIRTEAGRRIRRAFIAEDGQMLVAADYSQIELRIMAHLSSDAGLLAAFRDGLDVHRATAAEVFGGTPESVTADQRRAAKAINFGLMYGMGPHGLARQLGIGRGQAQEYIDTYFRRYPGVRDFMQAMRERARRQGFVETLFGRRLHLDDIRAKSQAARAGAERAAINAPMQGTAADIVKRAMISVDAWLREAQLPAAIVLQVHDELVLEVAHDSVGEVSRGLVERMEAAATLDVPLVVDVGHGPNWDEAH